MRPFKKYREFVSARSVDSGIYVGASEACEPDSHRNGCCYLRWSRQLVSEDGDCNFEEGNCDYRTITPPVKWTIRAVASLSHSRPLGRYFAVGFRPFPADTFFIFTFFIPLLETVKVVGQRLSR